MNDAIVIGGGFYGIAIAHYLKRNRGFRSVAIIERENELLTRASLRNQARIHNGYHYPRSFVTAIRSRINLPRFVRDFPFAVFDQFTKIYAIARDSKVSPRQFERFCQEIGATLQPAPPNVRALFASRHIEAVYLVQEYAFNAVALRRWAQETAAQAGIDLMLGQTVRNVQPGDDCITFELLTPNGASRLARARYVFNCTYSGLRTVFSEEGRVGGLLKHEIAEMALIEVPAELRNIGVTVMDGPFFSCMPFPSRELHTLSHVRYTPHVQWHEQGVTDPNTELQRYHRQSRADRMLRDAARYMPALQRATVRDTLFEVKTVLARNEIDDGRPIYFERVPAIVGAYNILGGKIDNVYDILTKLDDEALPL
ncbi:MAG: FAD-dependent oxidoreductase [Pandoraea sp.]|nr:FAD-dependent oxidoreductase [Pandoraea sp.]MDR3396775.1 FAD-dependent oxidoreductase [Pandoraea sp.]